MLDLRFIPPIIQNPGNHPPADSVFFPIGVAVGALLLVVAILVAVACAK